MSTAYQTDTCEPLRPVNGTAETLFGLYAPILLRNGYSSVPIRPGSKAPIPAEWDRLRTTPLTEEEIARIAAEHPKAGLGLAGGYGGLTPMDIDTEEGPVLAAIATVLPEFIIGKKGQRGNTALYRDPSGRVPARKFKKADGTMILEVLTTGQTVIPPTTHPETRKPYTWLTEYTPFDVRIEDLSEVPSDIVERLEEVLRPWLPPPVAYARRKPKGTAAGVSRTRMRRYAEAALEGERCDLAGMLPNSGRNDRLFLASCRLGKYVHHGVLSAGEVEASLLDACSSNGLIKDDGLRQCKASLASGLRKAEGDELPNLEDDAEQMSHKQERTSPEQDDGAAANPPEREKRSSTEKQSQATMLAAIAMGDDVELFRTPEGDAYADIRIDGHRETWKVNSRGFKYWLRGAYFKETGTAVGNDATASALDIVEAQAQFGGPVREVHLRVAEHQGPIYINLANSKWQAVEIRPGTWRVVDEPPVRFVRKYGMLELPEPVSGGSIAKLREHLRMSDDGFALSVAWLLAALRPRGPYPVLALTGEQGTAKSTTLKMLRNLVDPNAAPLRAPPDSTKDLYVSAINGHVITFDNVSYLSTDVSDAMCRLSTGGGFSTRALYTDNEELLFDGQRPQGSNGIGAVVSRPDLLERTLGVQLEAIPDNKRKLEEDLWATFNATRPHILGALYDAVAHGLKLLPEVRPNRLPRMADFARWSIACETAYQPAGTFMMAYASYIDEAADIALESDIVAQVLMEYMRGQRPGEHGHREVETTSGQLLDALTASIGEQKSRNKLWPKTPEGMAAKLTRLAPVLRKIGITMERQPREPGTRRRLVIIRDERGNL